MANETENEKLRRLLNEKFGLKLSDLRDGTEAEYAEFVEKDTYADAEYIVRAHDQIPAGTPLNEDQIFRVKELCAFVGVILD